MSASHLDLTSKLVEAKEFLVMHPGHPIQVMIVVYSRFGTLRHMSERIAEGVRQVPGAEAHVLAVADEPIDDLRPGETELDRNQRRAVFLERLTASDALIVGAPAYFGSMASAVKRLFEDGLTAVSPPPVDRSRPWRHEVLRDKVGAAFTASGTPHGGNELALHSILTMFMHLGMLVVTPGQAAPILLNDAAPYGATAVVESGGDDSPSEEELNAAQALGARVAMVASWLRLGRAELAKGDSHL